MKLNENQWQYMKINENKWKSMKIKESQWKNWWSTQVKENQCKPMKIHESLWTLIKKMKNPSIWKSIEIKKYNNSKMLRIKNNHWQITKNYKKNQ